MKGQIKSLDGAHLSERHFRAYESIIEDWLAVYPDVYSFSPSNRALSTAVSGIRSAINAVLTHGYPTKLDTSLLRDIWPICQVILRGKSVCIGTRDALTHHNAVEIASSQSRSFGLSFDNPSERVLNALAILFLESALTEPVLISGALPQWTPPPGVVLQPNGDNTFTML